MTIVRLAHAVQTLIDETPPGVPDHLSPSEQREYMHLLGDLIFLVVTSPVTDEPPV